MAKTERTKLIQKVDATFSEFVRRKHADEQGRVACFTCGAVKHWKEMHAGHFQTRAKYATRWHDRNVRPQCPRCNIFKSGEQYAFAKALDAEHGEGTADEVVQLSNQRASITMDALRWMLETYRERIRELE